MAELLISWLKILTRTAGLGCLAAATLVTAGCAGTRGGPIPYEVQGFRAPDAPEAATVEEDYRIATLDTLRVNVFQVADLSGEFQVDLAGNIAMPLVGNVPAVGLTMAQLQQSITQQLGQRYLNNPDVTVGLSGSSQRVISVDGAVKRPGPIPVQVDMTLMQAVAAAGGTDEYSNPRRVAIFRQIDGRRMAAAFDLTRIRRGQAEDPEVYRGDIIVVDGSRIRQLQRDILNSIPVLTLFRPF